MSLIPESVEYNLGLPQTLIMTWFVWIILIISSYIAAKKFDLVPSRLQNIMESIFEYVINLADEAIGEQAVNYYPLFIGLFVFVFVSNIIGLIPGFISPTSDPNLTGALALIVFLYYNYQGIKKHGGKYFMHFFGPKLPWFMFPISILIFIIEVIGAFARPFSLALRLFCNIFSKEMLLGILALLLLNFFMSQGFAEKMLIIAPLVLRPFVLILGLVVGLIQALIFLILSISYIGAAIQTEEH